MVQSTELLRYSVELTKLTVNREILRNKLITQTADLQDFESNLFKLCVLDFAEEITFLKERSNLLNKVSDQNYCDEVYSVISNGTITFYDNSNTPLIRLTLNNVYESNEEEYLE